MKRSLLVFGLFLVSVTVFSREIGKDEALRYASQFFGESSTGNLELVWTGSSSSHPAFYAINRKGGGFVIVSGEESVKPLLGYSYTGSFKHKSMPANLQAWFDVLEKDIAVVRSSNIEPDRKTMREWANPARPMTKAGNGPKVLETAQWDQGYPYNKECVMPDGSRAVTGCVATAMSILMRYYKYPEHGSGTLSGYVTSSLGYSIPGFSISDHVYDWESMPLKAQDVKDASDEQKDQIARIMHDCGVMVKMDYSSSGSGAVSANVPPALAKFMGYSANAVLYHKDLFTPEEWESMLKAEIDKDRPIYYNAQDAGGAGGHAFIVDGYDDNGLFSLNWGWSGSNNAFYTLDLEVDGLRFSNDAGAILGLSPDPEKASEAIPFISLKGAGISLVSGKIEKGKTFTIEANRVENDGYATFRGPFMIVLTDKDGNIKDKVSSAVIKEIKSLYYEGIRFTECMLPDNAAFSDRLALAVKLTDESDYTILRYDVKNGTINSIAMVPSFILAKKLYSAGEKFEFRLFTSGEFIRKVVWYFDGVETAEPVTLTTGTHEVKAVITKTGSTETLVREIIVN
ncbi:MAG: C10 family peptidase [Bacteroidales bacterium]|nr:C10 family peptidase [Bacteroidales bacterium]